MRLGAATVSLLCVVYTGFAWPQAPESTTEKDAARILADEHQPFEAKAALADNLGHAVARPADLETGGRLALLYIRAMRSALRAIPMDGRDTEPYQAFIQRHQWEAVYSEPAGEWMLLPDAIWKLQHQHRSSSSAEAMAWEAVDNGMPGECEGYPPCELATADALDGEYLRRHPAGAHAAEVAKRILETCDQLERLLVAPNGHELFDPVTDCVDLKSKADALKSALQGARVETSQALASLSAVRLRCP